MREDRPTKNKRGNARAEYLKKQASARSKAFRQLREKYPDDWRMFWEDAKREEGLT